MKKAIGFFDQNLCIRIDNTYNKVDIQKHLPIILKGIDNFLNNNSSICNISKIVFYTLKDIFKADNFFQEPGKTTIIPEKCELYNSLEEYIKNHPTYKTNIAKSTKRRLEIAEGKKEFLKKNGEFYDYRRSKSIQLDNYDRRKGFTFYNGKHH